MLWGAVFSMKTPAAEAMEDFDMNSYLSLRYPEHDKLTRLKVSTHQTICTALALLDQVQSGKAKVLQREPTQEMLIDGRKRTFKDMTAAHMGPSAENTFKAMWDAAPRAAEVNK